MAARLDEIGLSDEERSELERVASLQKAPYRGVQRARLVLGALAGTINEFERYWNAVTEPFEWNFTRDDLGALIDRLAAHEPALRLAA